MPSSIRALVRTLAGCVQTDITPKHIYNGFQTEEPKIAEHNSQLSVEAIAVIKKMLEAIKTADNEERDSLNKMITYFIGGMILALSTDNSRHEPPLYDPSIDTYPSENDFNKRIALIGKDALANLPSSFNPMLFARKIKTIPIFPLLSIHSSSIQKLIEFCQKFNMDDIVENHRFGLNNTENASSSPQQTPHPQPQVSIVQPKYALYNPTSKVKPDAKTLEQLNYSQSDKELQKLIDEELLPIIEGYYNYFEQNKNFNISHGRALALWECLVYRPTPKERVDDFYNYLNYPTTAEQLVKFAPPGQKDIVAKLKAFQPRVAQIIQQSNDTPSKTEVPTATYTNDHFKIFAPATIQLPQKSEEEINATLKKLIDEQLRPITQSYFNRIEKVQHIKPSKYHLIYHLLLRLNSKEPPQEIVRNFYVQLKNPADIEVISSNHDPLWLRFIKVTSVILGLILGIVPGLLALKAYTKDGKSLRFWNSHGKETVDRLKALEPLEITSIPPAWKRYRLEECRQAAREQKKCRQEKADADASKPLIPKNTSNSNVDINDAEILQIIIKAFKNPPLDAARLNYVVQFSNWFTAAGVGYYLCKKEFFHILPEVVKPQSSGEGFFNQDVRVINIPIEVFEKIKNSYEQLATENSDLNLSKSSSPNS